MARGRGDGNADPPIPALLRGPRDAAALAAVDPTPVLSARDAFDLGDAVADVVDTASFAVPPMPSRRGVEACAARAGELDDATTFAAVELVEPADERADDLETADAGDLAATDRAELPMPVRPETDSRAVRARGLCAAADVAAVDPTLDGRELDACGFWVDF